MDIKIELLPLVDMDGVLSKEERKRIIKRLHSILAWVGSQIPQDQEVCGEQLNLRDTVIKLVSKETLTKEDLDCAKYLAQHLSERESDLENEIISGEITEEEALELLKEARGILRAIEELRNLEDRNKKIDAKICKVED